MMWKCPILCRCGPTVRSCSSNTTNRYKLVETCIILFTLVPIGLKRPNMVTQIGIYFKTCIKGQIISKGLLGVLNFSQKRTNEFVVLVKMNWFVRFLREFEYAKSPVNLSSLMHHDIQKIISYNNFFLFFLIFLWM